MRIAITGGIGSGKSFVCRKLNEMGITVYDCDHEAKRLIATSAEIREKLIALVGAEVYLDGTLNKPVLAKFLLQSEANKQMVNDIVHPAVAADYMQSGKEWLESAILFESGFHKRVPFDHVVCVSAPLEVRISRVMARDGISRNKALQWIRAQMPQKEIISRSQYEIVNDGKQDIEQQLNHIINQITKKRQQ
ncbi:MAG: dephospho-CoA kinase [Prevotella sp.]|nr:dephospho-CoA kinase [Prevotella sp.]